MILIIASQGALRALMKIVRILRVNKFIEFFIVLGAFSALPELFIAVNASLQGYALLGLGNVIGANILNMTIVAGLGILVTGGLHIRSALLRKDAMYMFVAVFVSLLLLVHGSGLSQLDGVLLLLVYLVYNYLLYKEKHTDDIAHFEVKRHDFFFAPFLFVVSVLVMYYASQLIITHAIGTSFFLGISPFIVGLVLISIGVAIPQLSLAISSIIENNGELSLGSLLGSITANSTLVLGVIALMSPFTFETSVPLYASIFRVVAAFFLFAFIYKGYVSKLQGAFLVFLYILFLVPLIL